MLDMAMTPGWEDIFNELLRAPGVAMVVGAVDTGKTYLCRELCNAGIEAGVPTAIVDADVGQSEVGAPGTIGMAMVEQPVEMLSTLKPRRLYFVGSTTPAAHLLECAVGTRKMVDSAREQGARLVVVDTTGLVEGALGLKLKTYKIDLVRPDFLIGMQRRREIEHILEPFANIPSIRIRRVATSELARRKPPQMRAARRRLNFYRHFHDCEGHIIRLDDVACWNTWFGTGRPMKWQYIKFAEDALKCRILHAEVTGAGIFIVSERACRLEETRQLIELFKTRNIRLTTANVFQNLLLGLADDTGRTLDVALLQAIDFKQRFMFVLSPIRTVSPVRVVQFGGIRVTKEGEELGSVKPGDL